MTCKIVRTLAYHLHILIFDEPTMMFNTSDADKLLNTTLELKQTDINIIYILHKLTEVIRIADRITVLRDGVVVSCCEKFAQQCTIEQIINDMVGYPLELQYRKRKTGDMVL